MTKRSREENAIGLIDAAFILQHINTKKTFSVIAAVA